MWKINHAKAELKFQIQLVLHLQDMTLCDASRKGFNLKYKDCFTYIRTLVWAQRGSTPQSSGPGWRKKGVATQFYVLRTVNITPLFGRTSLTTKVWVQSLGMVVGRYQALKTIQPVGRLPLIVSYILILLKAHSTLHSNSHTNTSIHLSI